MADRQGLPQYNVNFNPNMLAQAQQHMRNQQAQQQSMGFADLQQRMWQQQVQHRAQQQQQQHQQAPNMTDQQMTELLRNQNMARLQAQQQQSGNFMGMQGGNPAGANHPQGFPNQNMAQQTPPNFNNGMQGAMHPQQARSPGMQHVMQNSQSHARQLELMGMAQNQQNQNINFAGRPPGAKPQGSPQPAPHPGNFPRQGSVPGQQPDIFTPGMSDDPMRRGSPANPNMPAMTPQQDQIYQRARYTKQLVVETEKHIQDLNNARAGMPDQLYHTRMNTLAGELRQRNDLYHKFSQLHAAAMKGMNVTPQLMNAIQMNTTGPPPAWMTQAGLQSTTPAPDMRSPQLRNSQASPNVMAAQPPVGSSPDVASSLRVATPQQPTMNNGNTQMPPQQGYGQPNPASSANNAPNAKIALSSLPYPPPLDRMRFETTFGPFREAQKIQIDERLLTIENRQIDLYPLHVLTMQAGGFQAVINKDLWAVIGGRMGFVHFPANGSEPPRSGPGVASLLENAYKMYLLEFEKAYVVSQQNTRLRIHQQQQQVATQFNSFPTDQQTTLLNYARQHPDELRKVGISEKVVNFVEQNRAYLQKLGNERAQAAANRQANGAHMANQPGQSPGMLARGQPPQMTARAPGQNPNPAVQNMVNLATAVGIPHPQLAQAYKWCQDRKGEFISRVSSMSSVDIPVERRVEYNELFTMLHRLVADLDDKIPLFFVMTKDTERVRRLLGITTTVGQQQTLLSQAHAGNNVRYLISAESVKEMLPQVQHALEHFMTVYQQFRSGRIGQAAQANQSMPPGLRPPGATPNPVPGRNPLPVQPAPPQMLPPAHHNAPAIPIHPRVNLQPPPAGVNRKPSGSSPAQTTDQVSTPAAAATPSQSQSAPSPSTPKSPKAKPKAKPIPKPKKATKPPTPVQTPQDSAPEASTSNNNGMSAQPASTAVQVNAGVKRAREEDLAVPVKSEQASSPLPLINDEQGPSKRIKSEWEGPPEDALVKKTEAVENVKTEEQTVAFLDQMSELLRTAVPDGDNSTMPNLSDTLDMILKGYNSMPDAPEASTSTSHTSDVNSASMAAAMASADEFFDFSSFIDDDESKPDTPDLVPSSSTNPSPESEADPAQHHSPLHGLEDHDPFALGTFKAIDGGESAYYQATDWKWEGSMPSSDWAVYGS